MRTKFRALAFILLAAALLAPAPAGPAAAVGLGGESGLAVNGYLEETLGGQGVGSLTAYYLLSHLRLKVSLPDQEGVSGRGEFDLYGLGTRPLSLTGADGSNLSVPATLTGASVDRLYLRLVSGQTQATIGRQRIPWGNGTSFAPADLFNPPNPLDPEGPRTGADGITVRRALGSLGYMAAAAAYVNPALSPLSALSAGALTGAEAAGTSGPSGGLSGSAKAGTHLGRTDLDLGWGYDALNGRHVTFAEARGDLGVGWHASLARLRPADTEGAAAADREDIWTGSAGVDYSVGGKVVGTVEYAAGPAAPRYAVGATYLPSEVVSLGAHVVVDTAPGARSTAILSASQTLTSVLDVTMRLLWPFGEGSGESYEWQGAGEVRLRYSF